MNYVISSISMYYMWYIVRTIDVWHFFAKYLFIYYLFKKMRFNIFFNSEF